MSLNINVLTDEINAKTTNVTNTRAINSGDKKVRYNKYNVAMDPQY